MSRELHHFACLTPAEQRQAIRKLAAAGMPDHVIAAVTRLGVEMVRRILSDRQESITADRREYFQESY